MRIIKGRYNKEQSNIEGRPSIDLRYDRLTIIDKSLLIFLSVFQASNWIKLRQKISSPILTMLYVNINRSNILLSYY